MNKTSRPWIELAGAASVGLALAASCIGRSAVAAKTPLSVPDEIRIEATRPSISEVGHALPLATDWNESGGFSPAWQLEMIQQGHYLLPWFAYGPEGDMAKWNPVQITNYNKGLVAYYQTPLEGMAKLHLPICFLTTQWEQELSYNPAYRNLPADQNPNVVAADGTIQGSLSPFGSVAPWREIGKNWALQGPMAKIQEWYPNPPLVIFVSNNETARLSWWTVEQDRRYTEKYGKDKDEAFKRNLVAKGWEERYRAIQGAFMDAFPSSDWKKHTIFIGYNAWAWPGRPPVAGWDGGSPEYYVGDYTSMTDFQVNSPEVHFQDSVPVVAETYKVNPKFWFEYSTWDGNQPGSGTDKMRQYAKLGQSFPPERYGGYIQFGMWLNRPRAIREFRGSGDTIQRVGAYFTVIMDAVDRVHTDPVLRAFWRKGELVPNRAQQPLSPSDPTSPAPDADRWFLLDTSLDPQRPWDNDTVLPVMSLALVQGKAPSREWLVYTYAPLGARKDVIVTVPGFGPVTVDASQGGSFYQVSEKTKKITTVVAGGPASVRVAGSPQWADAGKPVTFTASDPYSPAGKLTAFRWDFGDGAAGKGLKTEHAYSSKGTFVAKLTATGGKDIEVVRFLPVYVGQETNNALVLRFPMVKNDDTVVLDASGHSNNGLRNGGQYVNDPQRGMVLQLNGKTDCIPLSNTRDINMGGPFPNRTLSLWFKPDDLKNRQCLYEEGGSGNGFNLYLFKGKLYAGAWASAVWPGTWIATDTLQPNQWVHVTLVLRGADAKVAPDKLELYIDGKKVASGPAAAVPEHTADINVGRCGNSRYQDVPEAGEGDYFTGRLGEMRIYNRALSETEIVQLAR